MKKVLIIGVIVISFLTYIKDEEQVEIPNDAIRIRILANSNSIEDQYEKIKVEESLTKYLNTLLKESNSKEETKQIITNNMDKIKSNIKNTLNSDNFKVNYGLNKFPKKNFKGVLYPEGKYESLVITLGNGLGENWWCVLFPPLCLMEENESSDIEYKFYVKEIINKYS